MGHSNFPECGLSQNTPLVWATKAGLVPGLLGIMKLPIFSAFTSPLPVIFSPTLEVVVLLPGLTAVPGALYSRTVTGTGTSE
jgi:hypothetical protein